MINTGFSERRVLALESRRGAEMAKLIAAYKGRPTVVPSMREVPIESNEEALEFVSALMRGAFDMVIFLTGVGTRALVEVAETVTSREQFAAALGRVAVVARGPKPLAVLRQIGVPVALTAPEPNTWRELLAALDERAAGLPLRGRRVAVQEYGESNPELLAGLAERGAEVMGVSLYRWALPEDIGPLREAIAAVVRSEFDVILFTTATQVDHLFQLAAGMDLEAPLRHALEQVVVASIGPTTSDALRSRGLVPDLEPSHPKMGILVNETAGQSGEILRRKRARR